MAVINPKMSVKTAKYLIKNENLSVEMIFLNRLDIFQNVTDTTKSLKIFSKCGSFQFFPYFRYVNFNN